MSIKGVFSIVNKRNNQGFTLLELMIVISIIGILAVVLIPKFSSLKNNAKEAGLYTNVQSIRVYLESKIDTWNINNVSVSDIGNQIAAAFSSDNSLLNPITMQTSPPPAAGADLSVHRNRSLYVAGNFDGLDVGTSANRQYLSGTTVVAVKGVTNDAAAHLDRVHIYAHGKDGNIISETIVSVDGTSVPGASGGNVNVSGVGLNQSSLTLYAGNSQTLMAQVTPAEATNKNVTWSSDNPTVASIDSNGLVLGVSEGQATVKVTTEDGAKTASCTVTVKQKPIQVYYKINTVYGNPGDLTYQYQIEIKNNTGSNLSNWSLNFYLPTNKPQTASFATLTSGPSSGFYKMGPGNQWDIIYAGQIKNITGQGKGDGKEPIQIESVSGYGSADVGFTYRLYP